MIEKYIENPKTKGSGIYCCIPQSNPICPYNCEDCFYQSGRSYLEPLKENLPNIPPQKIIDNFIIRVNDELDSSVNVDEVIAKTKDFPNKFYNTSQNNQEVFKKFRDAGGNFVLTINPGKMTDTDFHKLEEIPDNLMFVRFRTNTWNVKLMLKAYEYYCERDNPVPLVLTFMTYHNVESIPESHRQNYTYRKRTSNSYYAIKTTEFSKLRIFTYHTLIMTCGKLEGEDTTCKSCGNCLREFYNTKYRCRMFWG